MFGLGVHHAVMLAGGWVLFAIGVIGAPLPFHPGLPLLALGGIILAGRSPRFRRLAAMARARFPAGSARLTLRSRRWPRPLRYLVLRTDPRRVLGQYHREGAKPKSPIVIPAKAGIHLSA